MPVLNSIPFKIDLPALLRTVRIREGSANAAEFSRLVAEAEALARPRAVYRLAFVEQYEDGAVVLDGRRFTSRVLRVNLADVHRVVAFVATSGAELEAWAEAQDDPLRRFWADAINQRGVGLAGAALHECVQEQYGFGTLSAMNPGSLADWPLTEQRALFALLGDVEQAIGVRLSESLLMVPTKSVSGLLFPAEKAYANCQLCPREDCPNRRAAYEPELFARKYAAPSGQGSA